MGTKMEKFGWEEYKEKVSYMEYCPQAQKGIQTKGLFRGEEGELFLIKEASIAISVLMGLAQVMSATKLNFTPDLSQ